MALIYAGGRWREVDDDAQANVEPRNPRLPNKPAPGPGSKPGRGPGKSPEAVPMPRLPMPPRTPTTTDDKPPPPAPTVTGTYQKRVLGGYLATIERLSDGTEREVYRERSQSAGDAVNLMFQNLGLGQGLIDSMNASIKSLYANFLDPSEAQILNEIYTSDAYKQRFKAMRLFVKGWLVVRVAQATAC